SFTGIYSKLKDPSVPRDEKLFSARLAWDSTNYVIPNKQQVLLDWIIQEIFNESKKGAKYTDYKEYTCLWKLLLHALQSQQLVSQAKIPVTLKPQLVQVFTDTFLCQETVWEESFVGVVTSCCFTVLSNTQLASCLLSKFEGYVTFLSALLSSFEPICCDSLKVVHHLVEVCLENYLLVQRRQANQRKVFAAMCQQLFEPLAILRHKLKVHEVEFQGELGDEQLKKERHICELVEIALSKSLFHRDHLAEYQQALKGVREERQTESEEPSKKKARISSYPKLFFDKLWEMSLDSVSAVNTVRAMKDVRRKALVELLPFLFKEFIASSRKMNKSTSSAEFDFFTEMCEITGVLNGRCQSSVCALLHQMLECVLWQDVYQVANDNSNGSVQFLWLEKLVEVLIHEAELCDAVFRCLDVFLKLNHSLLEPRLEIIWKMLWKPEEYGAQHSLISSLITTYVKLRQFDKLVVAILTSLRTLESSSFGLTPPFKERFTKAIQGLPFSQITCIWNIFLEEIKENYIKQLESLSEQVLATKKNKRKSSPHFLIIYRKLEYVISIFNTFVTNIGFGGIGEELKTKPSVLSIETFLRQTTKEVLEPMVRLVSKGISRAEKESAFFSVLLLQYSLGELELFLNKFNLIKEDAEQTKLLPPLVWSDKCSDFVPTKAQATVSDEGKPGRLSYLKTALCVQNIRYVLFKKTETDEELSERRRLVSCVCSNVAADVLCKGTWDREVLSINKENAPVALWELFSRHAVVILPLCTADQQQNLAHLLVRSITQETQATRQEKPGYIAMSDVSMEMIQSTAFHEMLPMQTTTVCALWSQLKQAIDSKCTSKGLGKRLLKALSDIVAIVDISTAENKLQGRNFEENSDDDAPVEEDESYGGDEMEEEEGEEVNDGANDDDSFDEDNVDEEKVKETGEIQGQTVGNLKDFYALGCELTDISGSVLLAEDSVVNVSAAESNRILKVLGYLPLDWLSDCNHARCLTALFTCDILFTSAVLKEYSSDLLKTLLWSRQVLKALFDGCVRRRRFIAHHVIDFESLLHWFFGSATKLWRKFLEETNTQSVMYDMLSVTRGLVYSTVKYLFRAPSGTFYIGQTTIQKIQGDLRGFSTEVRQCSKHSLKSSLSSFFPVFVTVEGILAVCEEAITNKTSSSKTIKISSDIVIKLGPDLLELMGMIVRMSQRKKKRKSEPKFGQESESNWHHILLQFPVLIDSLASLLHIYSVSEQSRKLMLVNERYKLCQWQEVFDVMLTVVIQRVFEKDISSFPLFDKDGSRFSCLRFLKVVCQSCTKLHLKLPGDFHTRLLASTLHFLKTLQQERDHSTDTPTKGTLGKVKTFLREESRGPESEDIFEEGYRLVVSLLEGCDPVLLSELLEGSCSEITKQNITDDSLDRLFVTLNVWLRLLNGPFAKNKKEELRPKLPKVLFALQFLLQELTADDRIFHIATDIMVKILSLGKGMVLPHNALLVLHSGLMTKNSPGSNGFSQLFESQYSLLSTLLFQHSEAVYGAVHVFITCVRNLLSSLLQICGENGETERAKDDSQANRTKVKTNELIQSAQRMSRWVQSSNWISKRKCIFTKYTPFFIKNDSLTPGVYCLLDMCGEHELSLMHAVLDKGSRELFHSLHADYTKYHKFKGKV
ncbi:unnamed protein product, partial [Porites evermanni]